MLWWRRLQLRIRSLTERDRLERELDQELVFHLAEQKADYERQAMTAAEAEFRARREFGALGSLAEQCRDQRHTRWIEDLLTDARFAIRGLRQSPGFTWAAVATIALGLGANLALFSTAYRVLFRPLPYADPDQLLEIAGPIAGVGPATVLRQMAKQVEWAGYLPNVERNAQLGGGALRLRTAAATWNLAGVLGVQPAMGRWFEEREESAGRHRVAVISQRMWRERFSSDPGVLGRRILLDEEPYEIIGVMPAWFTFPAAGTELWVPIRYDPADISYLWGSYNLLPIGRLSNGGSMEAAQAELSGLIQRIRPMFPWRMPDQWGVGAALVRHQTALVSNARPKLIALAAASLFLLIIACGNVSNLLLARWIRREREFATREALGAGRGRLLRQLVTENLVLAGVGGVAGIAVALGLLPVLPGLVPDLPRLDGLALEPRAAVLVLFAMGMTFGVLSLVPMFRTFLLGARSVSTARMTLSRRPARVSLSLAGFQLALATALLIGAGLMARTLWRLDNVDSGIRAPGVLTATVSAGPSRCATAARCRAFVEDLTATLGGVAGVQSVNWSNGTPLVKRQSAMSVAVQDHPRPPGAPAFVLWHLTATPGYFPALGIPLRSGRLFTESDTARALPVAIISESTAQRFWPDGSAIGKTIRPVSGKVWRTVVGVVADVAHYSLAGFPSWVDGVQYVPLNQSMPGSGNVVQLSIFLQGAVTAGVLEGALRKSFPDVVLSGLAPLQRVRRESVADRRSTMWLLSGLASMGLLLGSVGVYGILTQRFAQRTREIGIRLALGATTGSVAVTVLREALVVAAMGSVVGISAAIVLTRYLRSLLFGVAEHDLAAFLAGPVVLIVTALLAAALPGLRAARVDPATVLRAE
ncbi:MAG: ABC transporter permease [Acidobacteria bacterium]|nr:ABC transporter permease [Acidobacteriota bacterium]